MASSMFTSAAMNTDLLQTEISLEEFETLTSICDNEISYKQMNHVICRVNKCRKRLQLRFPQVFRDGVILQYLVKHIKFNANIRQFSCGLASNYQEGFFALNQTLSLPQITKFNLRIDDLSLAPIEFFHAIASSKMHKLSIKFNYISDESMRRLCDALRGLPRLKELTFACEALCDESMQHFAYFLRDQNLLRTLDIVINHWPLRQIEMLCDGINKSKVQIIE